MQQISTARVSVWPVGSRSFRGLYSIWCNPNAPECRQLFILRDGSHTLAGLYHAVAWVRQTTALARTITDRCADGTVLTIDRNLNLARRRRLSAGLYSVCLTGISTDYYRQRDSLSGETDDFPLDSTLSGATDCNKTTAPLLYLVRCNKTTAPLYLARRQTTLDSTVRFN
jgi:hypothetical protein